MANWVLFDKFMEGLYDATTKINFDTGGDTLKIALAASTYTPDAAHDFFSDVTGDGDLVLSIDDIFSQTKA